MEAMDGKVFGLIVLGTAFVLEVLKRLIPKLRANKDFLSGLALLLPVVFTVIAKLTGQFADTGWVEALTWALGGGIGAGVTNDKILNPALKLFGLSGPSPAQPPQDVKPPDAGGGKTPT